MPDELLVGPDDKPKKILAIPHAEGVAIMRLYNLAGEARALANYALANPDLVLGTPVEITELPEYDSTFRDAYKLTGKKIEHDMPKARTLAKASRAERKKPKKDTEIDAAPDIAALKALLN